MPLRLRNSILQEDDGNSRALVVHFQDPHDLSDAGQVAILHGIKCSPRSPGGASTHWDIEIYAWYQDVVSGSAPRVFQYLTGNVFSIARPTAGATTYWVYNAATLVGLFAANLGLQVAAHPGAGAAGTDIIQT
jgi:hypothetical protein